MIILAAHITCPYPEAHIFQIINGPDYIGNFDARHVFYGPGRCLCNCFRQPAGTSLWDYDPVGSGTFGSTHYGAQIMGVLQAVKDQQKRILP